MKKRIALLLLLVTTAAGCLVDDGRTNDIYLDPDGSLTWTVLQNGIRSDAKTRVERLEEERSFLEAVAAGEHDIEAALRALHPLWVEARLLRTERPYSVLTSARLAGIDLVYREILEQGAVPAEVELIETGDTTTLSVLARPGEQNEDADELPEALWDLFLDCRIHLTRGRFVEATGFEISTDRTVAVPEEIDEEALEGEVVLSLSWTTVEE